MVARVAPPLPERNTYGKEWRVYEQNAQTEAASRVEVSVFVVGCNPLLLGAAKVRSPSARAIILLEFCAQRFYKEQHEHQTLAYVQEMKEKYSRLNTLEMGVWEAAGASDVHSRPFFFQLCLGYRLSDDVNNARPRAQNC